uniref:Uncharacterized protein n=1 Tax=Ditylenchus dipsaci TaxID=166011 RepID=A0A915CMZ0_9BILA
MSSFPLNTIQNHEDQDPLASLFVRPPRTRGSRAKELVSNHWKMVLSVLIAIFISVFFAQTVYHFKLLKVFEANANLKLQELESELAEHKEYLADKDYIELESDRKEIGGILWFLTVKRDTDGKKLQLNIGKTESNIFIIPHLTYSIALIGTKDTLSFEGQETLGSKVETLVNPKHVSPWSYFSKPANGFIDAAFNATIEARLSIRKTTFKFVKGKVCKPTVPKTHDTITELAADKDQNAEDNKVEKPADSPSPHLIQNNEPDLIHISQATLRICLLGNCESGKTTVLEQIRKIFKIAPPNSELLLRRAFIYNNAFNSIRKILEFMQKMKLELEKSENLPHLMLLMADERTHGRQFTDAEFTALNELWKDKTIRQLYNRRGEYCLNDSTKYFMDSLPRIHAENFEPTHDDLVMAYIPTVGVQNVIFTSKDKSFQVFDIGGAKVSDRRWATVYEGLDAIIFTLAISVYDQKQDEEDESSETEFHHSLKLLEYVFKEKLSRVPLKNFFPDYKGNSEKEAQKFIKELVHSRCQKRSTESERKANIEFYFTCCIDTKQTSKQLAEVLEKIARKK